MACGLPGEIGRPWDAYVLGCHLYEVADAARTPHPHPWESGCDAISRMACSQYHCTAPLSGGDKVRSSSCVHHRMA